MIGLGNILGQNEIPLLEQPVDGILPAAGYSYTDRKNTSTVVFRYSIPGFQCKVFFICLIYIEPCKMSIKH